ncbi:hypothetical protein RRG08_050882 [Elysia crispata]|uniref:DUF19 domain-containing protein n=1 Tax=Elysia crispata TaxID=231223 RepID=A0AAE0ZDQ2_9GAST|nr:hypothetical protein RRG08_050882 [Elysia crispata]
MIWTLPVLLTCLSTSVDATDTCTVLKHCENPVRDENLFAEKDSMIFKIKDEKQLDRICGKLPNLRTCVSANVGSCSKEDIQWNTQFFKDIIEFICTPSGRPVALATGKSTCTMDPKLEDWFMDSMLNCMLTITVKVRESQPSKASAQENAQNCLYQSEMGTCLESHMNAKCGPEMSNIIEKMWELWTNYEFSDYNCGKPHAQSRRNLDENRSRWARFQS